MKPAVSKQSENNLEPSKHVGGNRPAKQRPDFETAPRSAREANDRMSPGSPLSFADSYCPLPTAYCLLLLLADRLPPSRYPLAYALVASFHSHIA
jgi:hypothetical protein